MKEYRVNVNQEIAGFEEAVLKDRFLESQNQFEVLYVNPKKLINLSEDECLKRCPSTWDLERYNLMLKELDGTKPAVRSLPYVHIKSYPKDKKLFQKQMFSYEIEMEDGTHRLAMLAYLGAESVPVVIEKTGLKTLYEALSL